MSDPFDDGLRERLERLSAAVPVRAPEALGSRAGTAGSPRATLRAVVLAGTLLILVSLGATAAILRLDRPESREGAFAPGGPLHCTGVDQLSPTDAERWLHDHDFEVAWQVEDRTGGTSTHQDAAPVGGSITEVLVTDEGQLLVLVDLSRATPLAPRPCP